MKTHKFARKPFYVDAVRVSEANIKEVADWCEGEVETDNDGHEFIRVKVHRPLTEKQTQASIGDWVLFAGTGFKVYTPKAFDKSFEKVKTLTKAQADEAGITVPHEPRPKGEKKPVPTAPARRPTPGIVSVGEALKQAGITKNSVVTEEDIITTSTGRNIVTIDEPGDTQATKTVDLNEEPEPVKKSKADIEAEALIQEVQALSEK